MSMWTRSRHTRDPRNFREEIGGRALGKIGLFYWLLVFGWVVLRSIAYGLFLTISTWLGRVVGGAAVVGLLIDASYGADPVTLPVSTALVVLVAGVAGYLMWAQRRRWETHLENTVYHTVPGHSRSESEVVWYPPGIGRQIQGGRWLRTPDFGFRIPSPMKESDEQEVTTQLRSRLPAARGASWMLDWDWRLGRARACLVEDMPDSLSREELLLRIENEGSGHRDQIPLGVSVDGVEYFDLEKDPHTLSVGKTGKGKSVAQLGVCCWALDNPRDYELIACDPKRVELTFLKGYENVRVVARDLETIVEAIVGAADEMWTRYEAMEEAGYTHIRDYDPHSKRLLVVVDELAQVTMQSGLKDEESKAKDELRKAAMRALEDVASLGRAAGVHLYLSTQRPDVALGILSGPLKHNLTGRLACGQMDATASGMALDSDAAAQLPARPPGRAVWQSVDGEKQIQVAFTRQKDLPAKEEVRA